MPHEDQPSTPAWRRHEFRGWVCHCGYRAINDASVAVHERRAARGLGCAASGASQPIRHFGRTHCIGCGCHDLAACWDDVADQPCHWTEVDRGAQLGVCSACAPEHLARWHAGDRSPAMPC